MYVLSMYVCKHLRNLLKHMYVCMYVCLLVMCVLFWFSF